ncbi:LacI family DNA-binding transcriptional regulator [Thalassobacillus sp. CUG 92003]|uniref:LacI family DNA-binding transcriptional regulator n=1 Tax=Thalassobacillus sp. CUG 92003 TaxID=2736641 RepID=UPI0015E6F74D|nr:LacI family DNA-binding transcriptional regulator [Thalassobacillus sp. CUG 92003]
MTTINDIAKMADVSRTTVSRALNDSGYVSEEVRNKIMAIVKETGYMPSLSAKSLRTKRSGVIGVILPKISTETSSRVVNGVNDVLSNEGFQILLTDTELNKQKEVEYIRLLKSRHVDGILILATNVNQPLLDAIQAAAIPVVCLGQKLPGVTSLAYNDYDASADMTTMLLNKGYTRLAFIGISNDDPAVGQLREQAYLDKLKERNLPVKDHWMAVGDFSIDSGYEAMKSILHTSKDDLPSAVFAVTDRMAVGAMEYLKEQGFRIPADMAIAGIGASVMSKYITPALTTIDYYNQEAGQHAARLLLGKINHEQNSEKLKLSYRLILRDSV